MPLVVPSPPPLWKNRNAAHSIPTSNPKSAPALLLGRGEDNPCLHPRAANPPLPRGARSENSQGKKNTGLVVPNAPFPTDPGAFPSPVCVTRQIHGQGTNQTHATDPRVACPLPGRWHRTLLHPPAFLGDTPVLPLQGIQGPRRALQPPWRAPSISGAQQVWRALLPPGITEFMDGITRRPPWWLNFPPPPQIT